MIFTGIINGRKRKYSVSIDAFKAAISGKCFAEECFGSENSDGLWMLEFSKVESVEESLYLEELFSALNNLEGCIVLHYVWYFVNSEKKCVEDIFTRSSGGRALLVSLFEKEIIARMSGKKYIRISWDYSSDDLEISFGHFTNNGEIDIIDVIPNVFKKEISSSNVDEAAKFYWNYLSNAKIW